MMSTDSIPSSAKLTLVAVHGVGDAKPGEISQSLSSSLTQADSPNAVFEQNDLLIKGITYPRMRVSNAKLGEAELEEVIEMNWADVLRPKAKFWSVPSHLFYLSLSMRHLSAQEVAAKNGEQSSQRTPWLARLYWWTLECLLFWATLLAVTVMLLASCGTKNDLWLWGIAAGAPVVVAVLARWLGGYTKAFRAGYYWLPIFVLAGISFVWSPDAAYHRDWVTWSARAYAASQLLVSATLTGAFVEALFMLRGHSWRQMFTRAALAWLPFLIYCGVAVAIWVGALIMGSKYLDGDAHRAWEAVFLRDVHYDLLRAELGTMLANVFIFLVMPLIGLAAYFSPTVRRLLRMPATPGETAHHFYGVIFAVAPFALLIGACFFWITLFTGPLEGNPSITALEIYKYSGARLLALLPVMVPAARNLLDIAGDVMFHLQPEGSRLSSQKETLSRLERLLVHLRRERPQNAILVLAHSQGSVIAWTLLCKCPQLADMLVTIGSPLSTLYHALLVGNFGEALPKGNERWKNLFCDGDYIGGKVDGCVYNVRLGTGSHTGYWADPRMVRGIGAALRA